MRAQIQSFYWQERAPKRDIHDLTQTPCLEDIAKAIQLSTSRGQYGVSYRPGDRVQNGVDNNPPAPKSIRQIKQNLKITFSLRYPGNMSCQVLKSWSIITVTSKHILKCVRARERDEFPGL